MRWAVAAACFAVVSSIGARGAAGNKEACIAAAEGADDLEDHGRLVELRESLVFCESEACPAAVRQDCAHRLDELDKRIPSVVVRAVDENGVDVLDASISVDDKVVATFIDGKPIKLDPGAHVLRVAPRTGSPVFETVVAAEGERLRPLTIHLHGKAQPVAPSRSTLAEEPGRPVQGWLGAGVILVGAVSTVAGLVLFWDGTSAAASADPSRRSDDATWGSVGVLFGVAAGVVGTVLVATSFGRSARVALRPMIGPGSLGLSGTF